MMKASSTRKFRLLPFVMLLWCGMASAEDAWTLRQVDGVRWPDSKTVTVKLDAGAKVSVLVREDGLVRVRQESEFGWVPADALTDKNPDAKAEDLPAPVPDPAAAAAPATAPKSPAPATPAK
jgi:hypothetical protein